MSDTKAQNVPDPRIAAHEERGDPCPGCRRPLPVRAQRPGEAVAHWECAACRTPLTGVLVDGVAAREADAIRLGRVHFDVTVVPPITPAVRQLVHEFIMARVQGRAPERRVDIPRTSVQLDAVVVPLDERLSPSGKPVRGIVVDLSPHGLGMITPAPIANRQIAVQIGNSSSTVQVVGDVAWTRDIGSGCHSFGVRFRLRLGRGAASSEGDMMLPKPTTS